MDRIELYRIFAKVVDCASFTRAADMLGLPRSSVSAAVQELEGRLGTRLLNRTTRKVAPTSDGAAFHLRCLRLIADVEEAEGLFRQTATSLAGTLRVDVPGRVGRLIVAPALPDFLERHPGLQIELGVTDRAVNLVEDSLDCALRVGPLAQSSLIARPLGALPLINVASPAYLARHGTPRGPEELGAHWAVNYISPTSGRTEPWEWQEGGRLRDCPMRSRVAVNSAEAYIACCLAGLGMIQIPAYDVRAELGSGALTEILPEHRAAPMPLTLLYPHRRHLSRRVQAFAGWLAGLMQREALLEAGGGA
ncbi:LysR family transcriptional regulator [Roseomonas sp. KE0001]|uniref:LysR family transcriptional regulator n=1 Tax=Roseomonas sp. KE0001 TaxID=2479201 RepID=UPI0018DF6FD9|nr:LysR family transcriptional regulator [Roseomonas sp. KE0001]MBI0434266.1 LysR family transcriptional regulator [Roseomonas sp. KE0001]